METLFLIVRVRSIRLCSKFKAACLRQSTPVQLESSISSFTYLLHFRLPVFPSYPAIPSNLGYTCSYAQLDRVFQPHFGKKCQSPVAKREQEPNRELFSNYITTGFESSHPLFWEFSWLESLLDMCLLRRVRIPQVTFAIISLRLLRKVYVSWACWLQHRSDNQLVRSQTSIEYPRTQVSCYHSLKFCCPKSPGAK